MATVSVRLTNVPVDLLLHGITRDDQWTVQVMCPNEVCLAEAPPGEPPELTTRAYHRLYPQARKGPVECIIEFEDEDTWWAWTDTTGHISITKAIG